MVIERILLEGIMDMIIKLVKVILHLPVHTVDLLLELAACPFEFLILIHDIGPLHLIHESSLPFHILIQRIVTQIFCPVPKTLPQVSSRSFFSAF